MSTQITLALAAFVFVASITPGPNNLMLMASGTNFGLRRTLPHIVGVNAGFVLMTLLVGLGLWKIFETYPLSYTVLKLVSVLYLTWLAWKIATAAPPPEAVEGASSGKPLTFLQAAAFQWVNPKAWAMVLTAMSAYTLPEHPLLSLAVIALMFCLIGLPSILTWAVMGTQVRRFLNNPARLRAFNITAALLLMASLWPILASGQLGAH